jgi:hypothetical protein
MPARSRPAAQSTSSPNSSSNVAGRKPAGWFSLPRQGDRYAVGAVSPNTIDLLLEAGYVYLGNGWPTTSRIIGSALPRQLASL